ncbi:hypothetical protein TNCT_650971 [Trichonephila clavata]|uniref:Uncharacterized protein n=1 Tax=Trichonephila clavata TaxID=2740835 RepID=A0A8X6FYN7_TRICU|nr:hypothetical protein TNCT_650971 [Trichonephila clavata]
MLWILKLTYIFFAISGPALGSLFGTADEEPSYVRFMLPFYQDDNEFPMTKSEEPSVKTENTNKNPESIIDSLLFTRRDTSLSYNLKYKVKDPEGHAYYRRESSDGTGLVKGYVRFRDENGFPKSIRYALRISEHTPSPSLEGSPGPIPKPFQIPHPTEAPAMIESAHKYDNQDMDDVANSFTSSITKILPTLIASTMDKERNLYEHETSFPALFFQSAFVPEDLPGQVVTGDDSKTFQSERTYGIIMGQMPRFGDDHKEKNSYDFTQGSSEISNNMIEGSSDDEMRGSSKIPDGHGEKISKTTNIRFEESSENENTIQYEESSEEVNNPKTGIFEAWNNGKKNALSGDLGKEQNEDDDDSIAVAESELSSLKKAVEMEKNTFLLPASYTNEFNQHNSYISDKDYKDEEENSLYTIPIKSTFKDSKSSMDLHRKISAHLPHDHILSHRKFDDDEEEPLYTTHTKPRIRISYHSRSFDKTENGRSEPNY